MAVVKQCVNIDAIAFICHDAGMSNRSPRPSPEAVAAWVALHRSATRLQAAVEVALKTAGLPPLSWYDLLHALAGAGRDGLRPYQLQERLLLAQYNVSRLLTRLEREGLVERLPHRDDGRGQVVRITRAGLGLRRRMWSVYGRVIADSFAGRYTHADFEALQHLMARVDDHHTAKLDTAAD